jgi:antiviral helicase SLH1
MVFVHARKETVKSAQKIKEMSMEEGMTTFFEATDHPKFQFYRKEISQSRNKEMKELFDAGFGIHHAGMLRSDRNMMEKMFEDQAIRVSLLFVGGKKLVPQEASMLISRFWSAHPPSHGVSISPPTR